MPPPRCFAYLSAGVAWDCMGAKLLWRPFVRVTEHRCYARGCRYVKLLWRYLQRNLRVNGGIVDDVILITHQRDDEVGAAGSCAFAYSESDLPRFWLVRICVHCFTAHAERPA